MANDNLLKSLLNKVDEVLNGKSDISSVSKDNYVAWCSPGIPFQPEDLQFAVKGINGKTAGETADLIRTAAEFSGLVNSIPSSNVIGGTFAQNGSKVWEVYRDVLHFSKVANSELTDKEKEKIDKFRKLLVVTKKVTDIITDEEKEIVEDSPMVKAYNEKMAAYNSAVMIYNNKRLTALNGENNHAVQDFAMNAGVYRSEVKRALSDWVATGFKEDIEKIGAYIHQVSQRSLMLLKEELQDNLEKAKMTDPTTGGDFYMTRFYPGNFINSDKGWTQFEFDSKSKSIYLNESHQSTNASANVSYGLFKLNADANHSKDELHTSMESDDFSMKFKVTQISLGRAWFSPDFILNEAWDWDQSIQKLLSDGKNPPFGRMIAYPTTAVFVKDVEITSSSIKNVKDEVKKSLEVGGTVGWGPFSLTARHKQNSTDTKTKDDSDNNTLKVEGMQLIAFKCFALPLTPNCKIENLE
jgi:hypothetical protein